MFTVTLTQRMHLELKETMSRVGSDIKQRVLDSLKATMGAVYSMAGAEPGQQEQQQQGRESPVQEEVTSLAANLNKGRRVDYGE